jgi:hypothetical protein
LHLSKISFRKRTDKLFRFIGRKILYYPGWDTSRKIVVIESDDWGSKSIPSKEAYEELCSAGIKINEDPYCKFDGLAEPEDLKLLFDVLTSFKDRKGCHPVITANTIMANPDFSKIKSSSFKEYHYELFTDTLRNNRRTESSFDLWREGIAKNIFFPQFHGREHLHIRDWMTALQRGNKQLLRAFELGTYSIPVEERINKRRNDLRAAFDSDTDEELREIKKYVEDGLGLFEELFKFRSYSIIAPCYTWPKQLEEKLFEMGISLLQGIAFQQEPVYGNDCYKKRYNYLGKKNSAGQYYSVRNVFFEPVLNYEDKLVERTLKRMEEAFRLNKPVIIGSHRLNYIGSMHKSSRDRSLNLLSKLFETMLNKWPDIEFMTSAELGKLIASNR